MRMQYSEKVLAKFTLNQIYPHPATREISGDMLEAVPAAARRFEWKFRLQKM